MSTGNYAHDNFVRVDCTLPLADIYRNAIHEVAHFTLAKNSSYGLLCFILSKDSTDPRHALAQTLRILEQGFERTHECYARLKEYLLGTPFLSMNYLCRQYFIEEERKNPNYLRYHVDIFDELFLNYEDSLTSPVFPDLFFILASSIDLSPLFNYDFTDWRGIEQCILANPNQLCPDYRLRVLLRTYKRLLLHVPAKSITPEKLILESGLQFYILDNHKMQILLMRMQYALSFSPIIFDLLTQNLENLKTGVTISVTQESINNAFSLSLANCVIPATLEDRFALVQSESPLFRPEKCILHLFLNTPESVPLDTFLDDSIVPSDNSALLYFYNPTKGLKYSPAFSQHISDLSGILSKYSGTLYLFLDDYSIAHKVLSFYKRPIFFRVDVPWDNLSEELSLQGASFSRFFLQKYTDAVLFLFGFCDDGNIVVTMLFYWEVIKIFRAVQEGYLEPWPLLINNRYSSVEWCEFRNIIAAITEDVEYAKLDYKQFSDLRVI